MVYVCLCRSLYVFVTRRHVTRRTDGGFPAIQRERDSDGRWTGMVEESVSSISAHALEHGA